MNDMVKTSISARKDSLFTAYDIKDEELLKKIEDLFKRIEKFGESCKDAADFETKFATDPLNQEYINLFTEVATKCTAKNIAHAEAQDVKSDAEYILDDVASELKYQAESATSAVRHQAYQEAYDKVRDIPGIGQAMEIKQHIDFFGRFGKKKEYDEDIDDD